MFCLINRRIILVKIGLFFQEISHKEFPGSNVLLPSFLTSITNGIFRWQICYLLLLISNPVFYRGNYRTLAELISIHPTFTPDSKNIETQSMIENILSGLWSDLFFLMCPVKNFRGYNIIFEVRLVYKQSLKDIFICTWRRSPFSGSRSAL